jgi:hypothetical protein
VAIGSIAFVLRGRPAPASVDARTGTLVIDSVPPGAQLLVDGDRHGVTPAHLVLEAGLHTVELRSRAGRKTLPVKITAGERQARHVMFRAVPRPAPVAAAASATDPGWLIVDAPFDLDVSEGGASLGILKSGRLPLPPGRHELQLVNDALGFRQTCQVQIAAGHPTTLPVDVPFGRVHVNASPWAQVWIDGTQVGDTPLGDLSVPIGPHEFRFLNPQFGEKRYAGTVTLAEPLYLTVDMRAE